MEAFLAAFLLTLGMVPGILLRCVPFRPVLSGKQKRILAIVSAFALTANFVGLLWGILELGETGAYNYMRYSGMAYAVLLSLVNILVIPDRVREHLFITGIVLNCRYLLLVIPNFVIVLFPALAGTHAMLVIVGVYVALLLLTYWPLRVLLCYTVTPFLGHASSDYWTTMFLIPIAFFGTRYITLGGEHNVGTVGQLFSSLLSVFFIVLICLSIAREHRSLAEKQVITRQLEAQKLHYAALQASVESARRSDHDLKHRMAAVRHYLETDDKEGLRAFIDDIDERNSYRSPVPYTGNPAADGILFHYMERARKENVEFSFSGTIRSVGITDVDLCVLLGNALDNAMTACATVPGRGKVMVVSQSESQLLSVMIRNSFDGKVEKRGDVFLSRKRNGKSGVGIESMREICRRYGGSLKLEWDEEFFTLLFILPRSGKE